jgi:diguanylate cyclase (GGDEF)-like protein/PAS domain S-box-containing protein
MRRARENERFYRSLFDRTNDGVFTIDLNTRIFAINQKAADLLGYQVQELIGKPYAELVPQEERPNVGANFEALKTQGMTPLFERTLIRKDGSRFKVEFNATTINDEKGKLLYFQGVARDVTERKRLEDQLRYSLEEMETLAMQDSLTGLLNRRAITEHAEAEWHRAQRDSHPMCLVLIDLDNLKTVNDSLGHQMGDQVILELAHVITASKRPYDWAGRWGGDEFLLVLPGTTLTEARDVAERLRNKYVETDLVRTMGGQALVSLGIACYSGRKEDETSLDKLITQADQALYRAKEQGRNQVEVYRD